MSRDNCFWELAPLYALDLLDAGERQFVETEMDNFEELKSEMSDFDAAVAALPYAAETLPLSTNMKARLRERIGADPQTELPPLGSDSAAASQEDLTSFLAVRATDLHWKPFTVAGTMFATLHIDQLQGEMVGLLRAEPGVSFPNHLHTGFEECYMIEGDLCINGEVYGPGDYLRSAPGSVHSPSSNTGCLFLLRTSLDNRNLI